MKSHQESQDLEFKAVWSDEYLKWICGFANAQGGRLFLGVDRSPMQPKKATYPRACRI